MFGSGGKIRLMNERVDGRAVAHTPNTSASIAEFSWVR